jgi:mannose-1-phosphate guanylyltransferase/mannose-6-phosphate isomerase
MDHPANAPDSFAPPIVPVLMAGGNGTRLWPLSRQQYPKQFLSLTGSNTLLQDTALRAARIEGARPPIIIGREAHRFLISEQLQEVGLEPDVILLEPDARDTAPAAAAAAHYAVQAYGPDTIVLLMASDHVIGDEARFFEAIRAAAAIAETGSIVTFGIAPTRPDAGYGYLKAGEALDRSGAFAVSRFVEKPPREKAEAFLREGGYYWNSGMFMFRADRFLAELRQQQPDLCRDAAAALHDAHRDDCFLRLEREAFCDCRKVSVDYAVMENAGDVALVPLDAGWDDVGCWTFLQRLPATDRSRNHVRGDVMLQDAEDNLVNADRRLVVLAGVSNLVVIETADAVLVASRDRVQSVKQVVQRLQAAQRPEAETHPRVYRPWGFYETVATGPRFQTKRIMVKPGHKLSLQMHHHRAEHWVVVKGTAFVTCGERRFLLSENESTYIPLGQVHRLENPGKVPLELIEVQSGAYLGEDDIVRLQDVYGRGTEAEPPAPIAEEPAPALVAAAAGAR